MTQFKIGDLPGYVIARRKSVNDALARLSSVTNCITPIITEHDFDASSQLQEFISDLVRNHIRVLTQAIERDAFPFLVFEEDAHTTEWHQEIASIPPGCDVLSLDNNRIECNHSSLKHLAGQPKYSFTSAHGIYRLHRKYGSGAYAVFHREAANAMIDALKKAPAVPVDVTYSLLMDRLRFYAFEFPFFYHGPRSNPKSGITYWPLVDRRVPIKSLEIHAIHSCNLACQQCSHFSDQLKGQPIPRDQLVSDMRLWWHKILPSKVVLLGGEPAAHPNLTQLLHDIRYYFPDSDMLMVSNGFLLPNHPTLGWHLAKTKCRLDVSIHHESAEYIKRLSPVVELLKRWKKKHKITYRLRKSYDTWRLSFPKNKSGQMQPVDNDDPLSAWEACISRNCTQLFRGQLWKCPQIAYLQLLAEQKKIDLHQWTDYLQYRPLQPNATEEEVIKFFQRHHEPICKMCPTSVIPIQIQLPFRGYA